MTISVNTTDPLLPEDSLTLTCLVIIPQNRDIDAVQSIVSTWSGPDRIVPGDRDTVTPLSQCGQRMYVSFLSTVVWWRVKTVGSLCAVCKFQALKTLSTTQLTATLLLSSLVCSLVTQRWSVSQSNLSMTGPTTEETRGPEPFVSPERGVIILTGVATGLVAVTILSLTVLTVVIIRRRQWKKLSE